MALVVIDIKKMPCQHLIWKKKKTQKKKKNINISIFKIEKNCRNPKFSFLFFWLDNQTQSWTSDMFDLLKSNQEPTQFFYFTLIFFPRWDKESSFFFCRCSRQSRAPQKLRQWQWQLQLSPSSFACLSRLPGWLSNRKARIL